LNFSILYGEIHLPFVSFISKGVNIFVHLIVAVLVSFISNGINILVHLIVAVLISFILNGINILAHLIVALLVSFIVNVVDILTYLIFAILPHCNSLIVGCHRPVLRRWFMKFYHIIFFSRIGVSSCPHNLSIVPLYGILF
jgi:hypothetical protein